MVWSWSSLGAMMEWGKEGYNSLQMVEAMRVSPFRNVSFNAGEFSPIDRSGYRRQEGPEECEGTKSDAVVRDGRG